MVRTAGRGRTSTSVTDGEHEQGLASSPTSRSGWPGSTRSRETLAAARRGSGRSTTSRVLPLLHVEVLLGGGADEDDGVHRPDDVRRPGRAADRHRQPRAPPSTPPQGRRSRAFLPSTSPSGFGRNDYYTPSEDYLAAVAEAMREEYLAIVESGFLLQVDDPWLIEMLTDDGRSDPAERRRRAQRARRGAQPRAARHPGGPDQAAHLLRPQPRPAAERHPAGRRGAGHAPDQRRGVLLRGGQPAAPARVADLGRRAAGRRARSCCPGCSGTRPTTSSIPS